MVHQIDYELIGDDMQAVIVTLDPGEKVQAEAGAMMYMTDGMVMNTGTGGGLLKGVKRILSGKNVGEVKRGSSLLGALGDLTGGDA